MDPSTFAIAATPTPSPRWLDARGRWPAGPHLGDGWIAYRRAMGADVRFVSVERGDELDAIAIVYLAKSRLKFWRPPEASLDRAPLAADESDPAETTARVAALVAFAREQKWGSLALGSFDGPSPPPDLAALGFATQDRFEFVVDLTPDDDARWSAIKQSHRRKIRKAEKAGVTTRIATDAAAELHALQRFTSDRRREQGESMDYLPEERYRLLLASLADSGLTIIGEVDGEAVSSMVLATAGPRAYYLLGGTNARGLAANAASAVFWHAQEILRARGVESLNLGGTDASAQSEESPAHGLYRFKLGWGTTPAPCVSGMLRCRNASR